MRRWSSSVGKLDRLMARVCYRHGQLTISETLALESGIHEFPSQKEPFLELNRILEALRARDLEPALAWAADNRDLLNSQVCTPDWTISSLVCILLFRLVLPTNLWLLDSFTWICVIIMLLCTLQSHQILTSILVTVSINQFFLFGRQWFLHFFFVVPDTFIF